MYKSVVGKTVSYECESWTLVLMREAALVRAKSAAGNIHGRIDVAGF